MPTTPETHRHYEFGTFDQRLSHVCAVFEIDPPEIVYEDGEPTFTEPTMSWIKTHSVNMDWLFTGSPCAMLREWSKSQGLEQEILVTFRALDPTARKAFLQTIQDIAGNESIEPIMRVNKV